MTTEGQETVSNRRAFYLSTRGANRRRFKWYPSNTSQPQPGNVDQIVEAVKGFSSCDRLPNAVGFLFSCFVDFE